MTGYGKRVLIVEHDEGERSVLGLMLENEGYNVQIVSEEGLALEELKHRRFDVVVSAHHMPQINGFRLILMGRLVWPDTPMIVLLENDTSSSKTVERGEAYGYLRKPYIFGELLDLIENAIKVNRKHRLQTSKSILLSS
ncbi:MAG: putative Response regulator, CheY-like (Modular protein) [Nitrospira sp.]